MDDLFVPVQKLTSMKEMQEKLVALGFKDIVRWIGETYDHESNTAAQQEDIDKLERIAASCVSVAKTPLERYLANLAKETASLYAQTTRSVINDPSLSYTEVREIVIGEGNLRVVATR